MRRSAVCALSCLCAVFLAGALAHELAPYGRDAVDLQALAQPPSLRHPFGTDLAGRDSFTRILYGVQTTERVSLLVVAVATLVGVAVGAVSGFCGGRIDEVLMRITDLVLVVPAFLVLLAAARYLGHGSADRIALILGLLLWTTVARVVRAGFLSLKQEPYVAAARACGAGEVRIMARHILPNAIGPIAVAVTLLTGVAILTESTISFLGLGIQPPTPSLGSLVADGREAGLDAWWLVAFPGLTIALIVLCVNAVGDGLRAALDPAAG